ncbi:hypothetical protein DEU56DRAFT_944034 [Suillus clintonianus]|uniref:uncharacterized protein n=1 Tax=Suillus clintonianus TaxID=1904413 RepID=UPI001B85F893|nr:uncharacterized protein DEU56DRAFT_944034 [Suillus clintonianus]KAG2139243.1 hypothetical protein DEU56DRAFT_944034 [Suillus clintonianus]
MSTNSSDSLSAAPNGVAMTYAIHPERDNIFRASAVSSEFLKAKKKCIIVKCTQCHTIMERPLKCAKCKSVWYCSKECQKKNWSKHKPTCHEDERSSGLLKLVQMITVNPVLMACLQIGVIFECGLLDNPRLGFDKPFLGTVHIAIEPSNVLNFGGLYVNATNIEEKLEGMVQVNGITAWQPGSRMQNPLSPMRLNMWCEARARCNAKGFAKDPVGLIEFTGHKSVEDSGNSMTAELHIPNIALAGVMTGEPFTFFTAMTDIQTKAPMSTATSLRFINSHIRADTQNQLGLRTEMTEKDKEVIRAAGRKEDSFPVRLLKEKMQREPIYANFLQLTQ